MAAVHPCSLISSFGKFSDFYCIIYLAQTDEKQFSLYPNLSPSTTIR